MSVAQPTAPAGGPPPQAAPVRRPGWLIGLAVALALALGAAVAFTAWVVVERSAVSADKPDHARDAVAAATVCTESVFSYDYRAFDESVDNGLACTTGDFRTEYRATTGELRDTATREKAVVRAKVSSAGVVEATPERVTVLLFVNQYRRNATISGEKVDENRVVLEMVPVDGRWLISDVEAI